MRGYLSVVLEGGLGLLNAPQRDHLLRVDEKLAEAQAELDNRLVLLTKLELNEVQGGTSLYQIDLLHDVQERHQPGLRPDRPGFRFHRASPRAAADPGAGRQHAARPGWFHIVVHTGRPT
jgi:hypothetical protein